MLLELVEGPLLLGDLLLELDELAVADLGRALEVAGALGALEVRLELLAPLLQSRTSR